MALADRLSKIERKAPTWAEWLATLSPNDLAALEEVGRDSRVGSMKILDAVIAEGGPRSKDAIREWRQGLLRDAR